MKAFGEPVLVTRTHFINDIDTLTRGSCSMMRQRQTNLGCACQYAGMVGMCAPAVGLFVVALCPPSDRVNFAEESLSSRRRRVCNKRTYAPMVGMVACIILYVFVNVLILYRWYEDGFLRWYEDGFASTSIAHHSMACFTLARTAGVGVKQFKETDAQPNGVARTYVADTAG